MRRHLIVPVVLLLAGAPLGAQQWDADQRDVLSFVEGCWDAWTRAVGAHDAAIWRDRCPPTDDLRWWWTSDPVPETSRTIERQFAWQFEHIERVVWWDVRPIAINVAGDVAMVWFYAEGSWVGTDGAPVDFGNKRLELFERGENGWSFRGGMVTPTTESVR